MSRFPLSCFLLLCAICEICGHVLSSADAATVGDIDKAVAAIADYADGKPRRPLFAIEEIVRKTGGQAELRRHLEARLIELLKGDASHECKLFVCQQLWVVGSDASLPALEPMLLDEKTAHIACYAIGLRPSAKADAALLNALGRSSGKARTQIIIQLGQRRVRASVPELGRIATDVSLAEVANAATAALGQIGDEGAAGELAKVRGLRPDLVAKQASLQCAERLAAAGKAEPAVAIFEALHGEKEPRLIRRGALLGLMRVGGETMVPLVISVLRGEDAMMRATAIAGIRAMRGAGVGQRFAAELPKLSPAVQVLLIGALAGRGDASARAAIAAAASSPSAEVRTAALQALGTLGTAASAGALADAVVAGRSEGETQAALVSLRGLKGKGVDAAIVERLEAAKPEARALLVQVLADRNAVSAVPALLDQTSDVVVRKAAYRALGRLAGPQDVPALVKLLVGLEGDEGRRDAEKAVVLASRRIADEATRADAALAALGAAREATARCSLLRVLGGIANARAFEALRAAAADADAGVQDAAVRALADWPDARAKDALIGIVGKTENPTHRVLALRGYVRLLGEAGGIPSQQTLDACAAALKQARTPQEKKLILGAMGKVSHPAALALVEPLLADPAVRAEAELALLGIARAVAGARPDAAVAALAKLVRSSKNAATRKQARQIVQATKQIGEYVVAWQVSGPYLEEGKAAAQLFGIAFPPEKGGGDWRLLPLGPPSQPWMLDLAGALGAGDHRVCYVRTWLHSEKAQAARLEFGTDDGNKVWLNGKLVHAKNVGGAAVPGGYRANVALRQGWNALVLKITQWSGPWQFCLAVRGREGGRLDDVQTDCLYPKGESP